MNYKELPVQLKVKLYDIYLSLKNTVKEVSSQRSNMNMKDKTNKKDNNYLNHIKRLPCQPSESPSEQISEIQTEADGQLVIEQFKREIQQRFKISVANKLYTFPRKFERASDIISSDEDMSEEESNEQDETLKPVSKTQRLNKDKVKDKKTQREKIEEKPKLFKRKQVYYVRENATHRTNHQNIGFTGFENKVLKLKKKMVGKSKQKQKQKKDDSYKIQRQKQTNRNKRFNTQPDSYNYIQTLRPKNKKI